MAIDRKYGKVTTEYGDIPDSEPVFVIRASDALSCPAISAYHKLCEGKGGSQLHLGLIEEAYTRFADWQEAHSDQVRTPAGEFRRAVP